MAYNGNSLLRSQGLQTGFTAEQVTEWIKCAQDPIYFIEKYIKIVTIDHGLQPMTMFQFQKDIVLNVVNHKETLAVCGRQLGKTTVMAAMLCHYIIFNDTKTCAILANKASTAREILARVKLAYEHLPSWLQHGVITWNKGDIELENGSRIIASSTSSSAIRGYSIHMLFLDEFAFVPNNVAEEFFTSVYPTITSGETSKLVMISTPNGMNHFYKYYMEAVSGVNGFAHTMATWRSVPSRTEAWAAKQLAVLGEVKFSQEMDCVVGSTLVTVRDKVTGEIKTISIENLSKILV